MTDKEPTLGDILATAAKEINERDKFAPKPHPDQHLQFYLDMPLNELMAVCVFYMTYEMFMKICEESSTNPHSLYEWAKDRTPL